MAKEFTELSNRHLQACVLRLPEAVHSAVNAHRRRLVIAGGFIRSVIAREEINDVDLFVESRGQAEA
jgi:hypothetical protein